MRISVEVNNVIFERDVEDRLLLVDFLRDVLGLTGTKVGCSHGVCGSCTIHLDGAPVRSCIMLAAQADGRAVRTIEDLAANDEGALHPLQRAFWDHHALQCGFCTPGFVMAALPLVESGEAVDAARARAAVAGNLCRCTGYDGIVDAVVQAAEELAGPRRER
jgi:aerobic-type carbon monoxide dehydrogenase small subunit (CoxS/CutS family)